MEPALGEEVTAVVIHNHSSLAHPVLEFIDHLHKEQTEAGSPGTAQPKYSEGDSRGWTHPVFIQNGAVILLIKAFVQLSCSTESAHVWGVAEQSPQLIYIVMFVSAVRQKTGFRVGNTLFTNPSKDKFVIYYLTPSMLLQKLLLK